MTTPLTAEQKIRLAIIVSDYGAAAHVPGARVETIVRTFDLPAEITDYIARNRGTYSCVTLGLDLPEKPT